jgi:predicted GIY-YIG superfamily endonuclease
MPSVYLLHFDPPYKHAQHYIGVSKNEDVRERVAQHRNGTGSAAVLCKAASAAGCWIRLARIWPTAGFKFEIELKARGSAKRICPICRARAAWKAHERAWARQSVAPVAQPECRAVG